MRTTLELLFSVLDLTDHVVTTKNVCYHSKMEIRQDARQDVRFSFSQPAVDEPILDFTLNQLETEPQFEEDVFRGFFNDEYKREGNVCLKFLNKHIDSSLSSHHHKI